MVCKERWLIVRAKNMHMARKLSSERTYRKERKKSSRTSVLGMIHHYIHKEKMAEQQEATKVRAQ